MELLEAEGDPFAVPIDIEDLHLDLVTHFTDLGRMANASPRHIGDVEQSIHPAKIDEGAEVGDVLDPTLSNLADLELLLELLALLAALLLEDDTTRHDDVTPPLVEFEDLEFEFLTDQVFYVGNAAQRDLRTREERIDAHDVDCDATLDLFLDGTADGLVAVVSVLYLLPNAEEIGFLLREDDHAFLVFQALQENVDGVPRLDSRWISELVERDRAFRLEAQVENRGIIRHPEYGGGDDLPFLDVLEGVLVHGEHFLVFFKGILVLVEEVGSIDRRFCL